MSKDWNYSRMWDTMRRALEESAREGLEVGPLDVLKGMHTLEDLEERHRQELEERKEREKKESFPIWQLETVREDGKECYRIYRAIDPTLPNWEGNRLYMPGTWDDVRMASNIASKKTAMEQAGKIREMQTMFDVKVVPYKTQAEEAEKCE